MENEQGRKRGIAEGLRRLIDQRDEERSEGGSQTAVLSQNGRRHVVGLVNLSSLGAMIRFHGALVEGDSVRLHLLDHGDVAGQVRWARDGKVGINFTEPLDGVPDE